MEEFRKLRKKREREFKKKDNKEKKLDCVESVVDVRVSYPSAEMQSVYFAAPADWAR